MGCSFDFVADTAVLEVRKLGEAVGASEQKEIAWLVFAASTSKVVGYTVGDTLIEEDWPEIQNTAATYKQKMYCSGTHKYDDTNE